MDIVHTVRILLDKIQALCFRGAIYAFAMQRLTSWRPVFKLVRLERQKMSNLVIGV